MTATAKSIFYFGLYMILLGITTLVCPNLIITLFGFEPTNEIWIRVLALIIFILGGYYVMSAESNLTDFFRFTVYGRIILFTGFVIFVLLKLTQPMLIIFGIVDLIGAIWTAVALKKQ